MPESSLAAAEFEALSSAVLARYVEQFPQEFIDRLGRLSNSEIAQVCKRLQDRHSALVLARMPDSISDELLAAAADEQLIRWLTAANADEAAAISGRLRESTRRRLLSVQPDNRLLKERLRSTAESHLGQLLQVDFLRVTAEASQADIIAELRRRGEVSHRSIFVCEPSGRYLGVIELNRALTAQPHTLARSLMRRIEPIPVKATPLAASKVSHWQWYRELPVVDEQRRLVGSLSWGDIQVQLQAEGNHSTRRPEYLTILGALQLVVDLMTGILDLLIRARR